MPEAADIEETYPDIKPANVTEERRLINWKNDLNRLIRRSDIFKQLHDKLPTDEVVATVREHERNLAVTTLVNSLVSNEFVVSPAISGLASDLSLELRSQFRFVGSVVLMGSAIHGGAALRNVTGNSEGDDLDWGITYLGGMPSDSDLRILVERADNIISDKAPKHGLPGTFESCIFVNPRAYAAPQLTNASLVTDALEMATSNYKGGSENLLYFQPSFPAEANVSNRKMILERLSILYKTNRGIWKTAIDNIMRGWQEDHLIKMKHLMVAAEDRKIRALRENTVDSSSFVMSTAMHALLESTSKGIVKNEPSVYTHKHA